MLLRHLTMITVATFILVSNLDWAAVGDDNIKVKAPTPRVSKADDDGKGDRFDYKVREDLFAGFEGDEEALKRGLRVCEQTLAENPRHAEALVWRGAARVFISGQAFSKGDIATGMRNWTDGLKDMDDAKELEPENIAILIPRAAVLLPAGRNAPPAMGRPLLMKVREDFEKTYERQENILDQLGDHPLGELRMGLADVYRLLDQPLKSKEQLVAIQSELPETAYAREAAEWLAASPAKKLAHNCIGCHSK